MNRVALLAVALSLVAAVGCRTNTFYTGPVAPVPTDRELVRVVNPELEEEFRAIRASELFLLSNDPAVSTTLRLHSFEWDFVCGQPFLVAFVTLGLVPVVLPHEGRLVVDLERHGVTRSRAFRIELTTWTSFWELFRTTDLIQETGKAIRASAAKQPE